LTNLWTNQTEMCKAIICSRTIETTECVVEVASSDRASYTGFWLLYFK